MTYALAMYQNTKISISYLKLLTNLSKEFEYDFGSASKASNNIHF